MKNILKFAAALAVMVTVSCNKEMNPSEGVSPEGNTVKVTMNATAGDPMSKMLLNGNQFEWEEGDNVYFRFAGGKYGNCDGCETLTAMSSGRAVTFGGTINNFVGKDTDATKPANVYAFYSDSENGTFNGSGSSQYLCAVPASQTGRLDDLKKYVIYASYISTSNMEYKNDQDGNVTEISFNAQMKPYFSLLKMTVPIELGLTSIKLSTTAKITGLVGLCLQKTASGIGTGSAQPVNRLTESNVNASVSIDKGHYTDLTIERGGEIISGDVYFTILPDAFDSVKGEYCSSASSLTFTFVSESNSFEYTHSLEGKVYMGALKNLGSVPANIMLPKIDAGALCLTDATSLTVGVDSPNPACTYYYEIGASKTECKTPTTASASFDPSEGFCPEITGSFDRYFIKVLAHTEEEGYRDAVLTASLRNWKFGEDSSVRSILEELDNGATMTKGTKYETSDGLEVYVNLDRKSDFEEDQKARLTYTTAYIQLNAALEYDSDAWISFIVDRNISVSYKTVQETENTDGTIKNDENGNGQLDEESYIWPNRRGYRLFYNNSDSTTKYWTETVYANLENMTQDGKLPLEKYNICLNLSDLFSAQGTSIKAGDKFGLRGDGKHVYYGMAMLEVL